MHNAPKPRMEDLPTTAQLRRSGIIAAIGAVAIGVMVYMPAELGIDPTGVGSVLGLTEMGQIKQELAAEAEADRVKHGGDESSSVLDDILGLFVGAAHAQEAWTDVITFTLAPGEATEIKVVLNEGGTLNYAWSAVGGKINFDLHAHAGGDSVDYERGRGAEAGEGSITAPFAGEHGWFWRNRDSADVTVTLQLGGDYTDIVRSE